MAPLHRMLRLVLPAALGLLAADALVRSAPAAACSILGIVEHEIDPDDPDAVAPGAVSMVSADVEKFDESGGCGSHSTCEGIATISVVVRAEDDTTPPEAMGFTFELVSGSLPPEVSLPEGPVRGHPQGDGTTLLVLSLSEAPEDSFELVVRVSAVDAAGNVGDSTDIPVVFESESGCAASGLPATGASWLLAAVAALFMLRTRRAKRAQSRY
jgi:hypothetical protein